MKKATSSFQKIIRGDNSNITDAPTYAGDDETDHSDDHNVDIVVTVVMVMMMTMMMRPKSPVPLKASVKRLSQCVLLITQIRLGYGNSHTI